MSNMNGSNRLNFIMITFGVLSTSLAFQTPIASRQRTSFAHIHNGISDSHVSTVALSSSSQSSLDLERSKIKKPLLGRLGTPVNEGASTDTGKYDPVLACPESKEPVQIITTGPIVGDMSGVKVQLKTKDSSKTYAGSTKTFYDLLNAQEEEDKDENKSKEDDEAIPYWDLLKGGMNNLRVLVPVPLRKQLGVDDSYVPMRDLFTSPLVSFAYERGWRQNFRTAGFPGIDKEFEMVTEFFGPAVVSAGNSVVVDMSCATGLMTRRLAKSEEYARVIGCDYSATMLVEARNRIRTDPVLREKVPDQTKLDLVRCDVAKIPMQTCSVDALHSGAAMHCWPEIQQGLSEIYRVLKPGGRFFATTFLTKNLGMLEEAEGHASDFRTQVFQIFESDDQIKNYLMIAGFEEDKIEIEILGAACIVIRCIK